MKVDLTHHRHEFLKGGLRRADLNDDPFKQFELWFKQAEDLGVLEPSAMSLATAGDSEISIRTVLLKYFDQQGFVFFTNYASKKSKQIEFNSQVALLFPWLSLERQVKISGRAERVSSLESLKYFASRPKDSQLGAWASEQSSHLSSRQVLLSQFDAMKNKFKNGEVPLPDFWGGYCVIPETIEFWQGRENRLHDRFSYTKSGEEWLINRLAP
ncbi:MAG: pyridoxamine 5'-phosphate oxidase [Gammaproteobacteria bacterium]|nr:MAG: pyridoxamine 5'-phosphate oxidase [Gammaproteobacteria bacterium]